MTFLLFWNQRSCLFPQLVLEIISFMFLKHFCSEKVGPMAFALLFVLLKVALDYFTGAPRSKQSVR